MVLVLCLVIVVTRFSNDLQEIYSGILAAFPIAGSTIAIFTHMNYSAHHTIRTLKSMKQGLLSMLLFFYLISTLSTFMDFMLAFLASTFLAILNQILIQSVKRKVISLKLART